MKLLALGLTLAVTGGCTDRPDAMSFFEVAQEVALAPDSCNGAQIKARKSETGKDGKTREAFLVEVSGTCRKEWHRILTSSDRFSCGADAGYAWTEVDDLCHSGAEPLLSGTNLFFRPEDIELLWIKSS